MEKTTTKKKKMKPSSTPQSTLNPSLPYDLLLNIIARISRLHYPTLSLVSKSFRSLISSPELYKIRSLLGHTESFLYVCLQSCDDYHWFTLCRKPNQTKIDKYVLAKVSIHNSPPLYSSNLVAVGSDIYNIGVYSCNYQSPLKQEKIKNNYQNPCSKVWILDCRSHTWHEAQSLPVKLYSPSASVLDGKIYVAGRCVDGTVKNWFNVFNTVTQIWDPEPISCSETKGRFNGCKTACIDGKFYVVTGRTVNTGMMEEEKVVAYNSEEGRWDMVEPGMGSFMYWDDYCEVENVLYAALYGEIKWYDTEVNKWRMLKGLVGLPKFPHGARVKLADYGGKLTVLWDDDCGHGKDKMIWCAEIVLVRLKSCEIWGIVEWFDYVLTVPVSHSFVKVIVVTV